MAVFSLPETSVGEPQPHSQARMVGTGKNYSATEGPEDLQNRSQPRQSFGIRLVAGRQPMGDAGQGVAQKGSRRLGGIQAASPAAEGGWIGDAIRVFKRGRRLLPGAVLRKASAQGLAASQQAAVGVRQRKQRKEGEGLSATWAATAPDPDPVVRRVVRLLAAPSVADDQIAITNRTSPQDNVRTLFGPVGFELVQRGGKWDKENRKAH